MKFIFFWLVMTFTLFSFTGCGDKGSSSPNNNNDGRGTTSSGNTGTNNTGGVPVPPSRHHGSDEVSIGTAQVHVFKYTGRLACNVGGADLEGMKSQLTSITVHNKYVSKDGKEYSGECDTTIGEINVYVIDTVNLVKSEKRGFCGCTPDPQRGVCIIYNYVSPPASGCN